MKYIILTLFGIGLMVNHHSQAQVKPDSSGGLYFFKTPNLYFEVNPKVGGRISSLKYMGKEILYTDSTKGNNNWGSTFWTSPQSAWGWPPPAVIDNSPYSVYTNKNTFIVMSSNKSGNFSVEKSIYCSGPSSVDISYSYKNETLKDDKVAPWEITRVPSGGLIFFPKGKVEKSGALAPLTQEVNGIVWFDYDSTKVPTGVPKLLSGGSKGWIAYVNNEGFILLKYFKDIPDSLAAPNEAEIELYVDPGKKYTEIEHQGEYKVLNHGFTSIWTTIWAVQKLPTNIPVHVGSQKLLDYVDYLRKTPSTQWK